MTSAELRNCLKRERYDQTSRPSMRSRMRPWPGRKSPGTCRGFMGCCPMDLERQAAGHTARSSFVWLSERTKSGVRLRTLSRCVSRPAPSNRAIAPTSNLKETKDEDSFNYCALFTWTDVYSLWPGRLSQFHPSDTADESACDPVLRRHQYVTFCCVLLRGATDWRVAFALRLLRAAR